MATSKSTRKPQVKKPVNKPTRSTSTRTKQPTKTTRAGGSRTQDTVDVRTAEQSIEAWMNAWPRMVAQAWSDDAFLAKLVREPAQVAREFGLPVLRNFHIQVSVGTQPPTLMLHVPPRPDDLGDAENVAQDAVERSTCNNSCTL
jgi:hypothetical protein